MLKAPAPRIAETRPLYAWSVAFLLATAQVFSFIDRQILSLLIGPIKSDLDVSDTEVALLHGFAFILFYCLMGIPLGRWADRGNRPLIMALGLSFWSLATAACGLARGFLGLFVARVGVGIGEASLSPAALSLLADYFPRTSVGRAIGLYMGGIYVGSGLAYIVGGAITQWAIGLDPIDLAGFGPVRGWQLTFFAVGLPGLALALLFFLVDEPRRRGAAAIEAGALDASLRDVLRHIWQHRSAFVQHFIAFGLATALLYGLMFWVPQTFVRQHGVSIADAGLYFGTAMLCAGPLGAFTAGWLADRGVRAGRLDAPMRAAAIGFSLALPATSAFALAPTLELAILLCAPLAFLLGYPFGIATSALQLMTPARMRGQAAAVYYITVNVIGFTTGPLSIALMTDYLFADDRALALSVAIAPLLFVPLGATLMWRSRAAFARQVGSAGAMAQGG